jgi:predicted DsbA family dithiol-disulfide isomerase
VRLRVVAWYDLASTLCYVASRVSARLADTLAEQEIALAWTPLDLAQLLRGYERGVPLAEERRANALRVAAELGVAVRMPAVWHDSRDANAAALLAEAAGRGAAFRERVWSAVFEEGRAMPDADACAALAREVGFPASANEIEEAREVLIERTEEARAALVTGVPTFMLGTWPFGGIQSEETMRRVLERYARKAREGSLA